MKSPPPGLDPASIARWNVRLGLGQLRECEAEARQAVARLPRDGKPRHLLGVALLMQGRHAEAQAELEQAARLSREDASIWDSLALCLQHQGMNEAAAKAFRKSLELDPRVATVWANASSNALIMGQTEEALRMAGRATALAPGLPQAQLARGNALSALQRVDEAIGALRQAVAFHPGFAEALLSLGTELAVRGDHQAAAAATRQALAARPDYVEAHLNLGAQLSWLGDTAAARHEYEAARRLDPSYAPAWSGFLYCLSHDETATPEQVFAEHRAFGERFEAPWRAQWTQDGYFANDRSPERRLRVGFVSADLAAHPVARFIEPIWAAWPHDELELFVYSTRSAEDEVTLRLRSLVPNWRAAARSNSAALFESIRGDRIDILFDLSGHTLNNRLLLFARKPAPVQVSWIGYPGSTGLTAIDYRLVDETVAPPGQLDHLFSERLAYLPSYMSMQRPDALPPCTEPPCLTRGHIAFGSFNRTNKINDRVVALWAQLLAAVPDSRLMIASLPDASAEASLRERFERCGIAGERLDMKTRSDYASYLARHAEVDLALDTFPYSATTTVTEALWMGVPTVTLAGSSMPQRLAAARMSAAGLPEFIAPTPERYIEIACDWAARPQALAQLRAGLRERMTAMQADTPAVLVQVLAQRLRQMWRRWCAGEPAETLR